MTRSLQGFLLLAELSEGDLATLGEYLEERSFEAEASLFGGDEESGELYLVLDGHVQLSRDGKNLATLGKGDALGGLGLALVGVRECAARALEPVRVLALDRVGYHRLKVDSPATALVFQEALLREFAAAVRQTLGDLEALTDPGAANDTDAS